MFRTNAHTNFLTRVAGREVSARSHCRMDTTDATVATSLHSLHRVVGPPEISQV
jgi:hypothetical protein